MLENVKIEVKVKNIGDDDAENIIVALDRWTDSTKKIDLLLPGEERVVEFEVNVPTTDASGLKVQAISGDVAVSTKNVPVNIILPKHSIKLIEDDGMMYPALIVDNRDQGRKRLDVEYSITKDGEEYVIDVLSGLTIAEDEVFSRIESKALILPQGVYDIQANFYENGEKIDEYTTQVSVEGNVKRWGSRLIFMGIIIIVFSSFIYVFFIYRPR